MNGTTMEGYAEFRRPEEIWQLVDYIRSLARPKGLFASLFDSEPSGLDYPGN